MAKINTNIYDTITEIYRDIIWVNAKMTITFLPTQKSTFNRD